MQSLHHASSRLADRVLRSLSAIAKRSLIGIDQKTSLSHLKDRGSVIDQTKHPLDLLGSGRGAGFQVSFESVKFAHVFSP